MSNSIDTSNRLLSNELSLWFRDRCVGYLGEIATDQPWLFSNVRYIDIDFASTLEQASYFLHVLIEKMPDFADPIMEDRHYHEVLKREGLTKSLVDSISRELWEIRCGNEREKIQFHSLQDHVLQWRGPMGVAIKKFLQ